MFSFRTLLVVLSAGGVFQGSPRGLSQPESHIVSFTKSACVRVNTTLNNLPSSGQSFGQLKPVVMELPITDIKGKGSEGMEKGVSGILGMDFLARFDVKLDFQTGMVWDG